MTYCDFIQDTEVGELRSQSRNAAVSDIIVQSRLILLRIYAAAAA